MNYRAPPPSPVYPCEPCETTGFSDRVGRGQFSMDGPICKDCGGRGWIRATPPNAMNPGTIIILGIAAIIIVLIVGFTVLENL